MENLANSQRSEPCATQNTRRLPLFFIINWKSLVDLSGVNLSRNGACVNGSEAQILVN
jgi:hypothetical protein